MDDFNIGELLTTLAPIITSILVGVIVGVFVRLQTLKSVKRSEELSKSSAERSEEVTRKAESEICRISQNHANELKALREELARLKAYKSEGVKRETKIRK